jgi:steroid 5-alpha reductase family enzyme
VQSIWCLITALPVYAILSGPDKDNQQYTTTDYATWFLWIVGFACEVIADRQKRVFKMDPENSGKFITTGLWSISQHPNYMGDIIMWIAMWLNCQQHMGFTDTAVTAFSPMLVYFLLTRVSGIPLLDKLARKKWGKDPKWIAYTTTVPQLFPFMGQRY